MTETTHTQATGDDAQVRALADEYWRLDHAAEELYEASTAPPPKRGAGTPEEEQRRAELKRAFDAAEAAADAARARLLAAPASGPAGLKAKLEVADQFGTWREDAARGSSDPLTAIMSSVLADTERLARIRTK